MNFLHWKREEDMREDMREEDRRGESEEQTEKFEEMESSEKENKSLNEMRGEGKRRKLCSMFCVRV